MQNPSARDVARIRVPWLGSYDVQSLTPYLERHGIDWANSGPPGGRGTTYVDVPAVQRGQAARLIRQYRSEIRRRNPERRRRRRRNPDHGDILDLALPALVLFLLIRGGTLRPAA